jgi:hypothetical protein
MYDAVRGCDAVYDPHRKFYTEALKETTGRFYNIDDKQQRPLNLLARNLLTLQAHLAHRNPGHEVTTDMLPLRGEAQIRALVLDEISDEIDRLRITRIQLLRALCAPMAVTKVGLRAASDMVKINGRLFNPGQPYILPIDPSDHLVDHQARCRDELTWEGHRYWVPRMMALESGLFDNWIIERLPGIQDGSTRQGSRESEIGKGGRGSRDDQAVEMIELMDFVFYDDYGSVTTTLPAEDGSSSEWLLEEEFQGPMRGPYEWLEFLPLPNQLFGLPPVALWRESSDAANKLFTKMMAQILRTKRIVVGNRESGDDLETIATAEDGDTKEVDDVDSLKNIDFGGLSPDFSPFAQTLMGMSNMQYANVDVAAGQSGGTDKATIYQGMQANANVIIDDLQHTHEQYESRISRQLHWYLDTDPLIQKNMTMRLEGGEFIQVVYDAKTKRGQYEDFTVKIKYGSMLRQDPQVKAQNLLKLLGVAMQAVQVQLQTGGAFNAGAAIRLAARHLGYEEADEMVNDPMLQQMLMARMQQASMVQNTPGQITGQSNINPGALYSGRPSPGGGAGGKPGAFAQPQPNGAPKQPAMAGAV